MWPSYKLSLFLLLKLHSPNLCCNQIPSPCLLWIYSYIYDLFINEPTSTSPTTPASSTVSRDAASSIDSSSSQPPWARKHKDGQFLASTSLLSETKVVGNCENTYLGEHHPFAFSLCSDNKNFDVFLTHHRSSISVWNTSAQPNINHKSSFKNLHLFRIHTQNEINRVES